MGEKTENRVPALYEPDDDVTERTRSAADLRFTQQTAQKPWLLVVAGRRSVGLLFAIRDRMTVGRAEADIVLDEAGVSRTHAQIDLLPGGVVRVSDLGSSNGVRVGGRLVKTHRLRHGEHSALL